MSLGNTLDLVFGDLTMASRQLKGDVSTLSQSLIDRIMGSTTQAERQRVLNLLKCGLRFSEIAAHTKLPVADIGAILIMNRQLPETFRYLVNESAI